MNFEKVQANLESRGFSVRCFESKEAAADYLDACVNGTSVGIGGSVTVREMGLYERLKTHNKVYWHWAGGPEERRPASMEARIYLTSANGLAETGEIINIDGEGNRVASTLYGHEKVYFLIGRNKIAPTYDEALWRARNIAAPLNARRLNRKTPCAVGEPRCHDCRSPERICGVLSVLWQAPMETAVSILLIDEDLGF